MSAPTMLSRRDAVEPHIIIAAATLMILRRMYLTLGVRIERDALASILARTLGSVENKYRGNILDSKT